MIPESTNPENFIGIKDLSLKETPVDKVRKTTLETANKVMESGESKSLRHLYDTTLQKLRTNFKIPSDLNNKRVRIRYKHEDGRYRILYLLNNGISLDMLGETIQLIKTEDSYKASSLSSGLDYKEGKFSIKEFSERIEDMIRNVSRCEILIEDNR